MNSKNLIKTWMCWQLSKIQRPWGRKNSTARQRDMRSWKDNLNIWREMERRRWKSKDKNLLNSRNMPCKSWKTKHKKTQSRIFLKLNAIFRLRTSDLRMKPCSKNMSWNSCRRKLMSSATRQKNWTQIWTILYKVTSRLLLNNSNKTKRLKCSKLKLTFLKWI